MVFGDEVEDDDGSFELVHDQVSPRHAQQPTSRLQPGSNQPQLRSLRLRLATMAENKGQPTDMGIDLTERASLELAQEKGTPAEKLRALLEAAWESSIGSESSTVPMVTLKPATSQPVRLLPAPGAPSTSSSLSMPPTQQRMVVLQEQPADEDEPKQKGAAESKAPGDEQAEAARPELTEKPKVYRRIKVQKGSTKGTPEERKAASTKVVLTREQRLQRLRRLQQERQVRMEKMMEKSEESEAETEKTKTEEDPAAKKKKEGYSPQKRAYEISISANTVAFYSQCTKHPAGDGASKRRSSSLWASGAMMSGRRRSWRRKKKWKKNEKEKKDKEHLERKKKELQIVEELRAAAIQQQIAEREQQEAHV